MFYSTEIKIGQWDNSEYSGFPGDGVTFFRGQSENKSLRVLLSRAARACAARLAPPAGQINGQALSLR